MCNLWGFHSSVAEDTSLGLLGTTCPVTRHHILEDLCLEILMFLFRLSDKQLCMWLIV